MKLAHSAWMERQVKAKNIAGRGARLMAEERRRGWLWLALSGFLALRCILCLNWKNIRAHNPPTTTIAIALVCMVGLVLVDRRIIPLMDFLEKRENDAIRGAEAEEAVGAILDGLSADHMVLHDVPGPRGNIDHVVLRKDGAVSVIETKSMRGRVSEREGQLLVAGYPPKKDFIGQTVGNAVLVRDVLAAELGVIPWVDAALVFTKASVSVRNVREEIAVMNIGSLEGWMARSPAKREVGRRAILKWERVGEVLRSAGARN